jgi:CBS domain containing-hemolysin-like protein
LSETWLIVVGLIAVVFLVAANGLFVATEFAYVAVRRSRVEQLAREGHARGRLLLGALRELDHYIAATQLGITMSSLALGWIGEPAVGHLVEPPLEELLGGLGAGAASATISFLLAFALITALHIVLGELAPKTIALSRAEATALSVAAPIAVFSKLFAPFIFVLNQAGRLVVRPLGIRDADPHGANLDPDELEIVIEASARAGLLSTSELLLARRALEFGQIQADQIMVPRTELAAIDASASIDEAVATVKASPHSLFPVYEEDLDHVVGVLDPKDLLPLVASGGSQWRPLVRRAVAVPETVTVEDALATMRREEERMLVLVDEHGGTAGVVTADEVLYRLLGRWLAGPGRAGREHVRPQPTGNILVSGLALVGDVEEETGLELESDSYDTVGGFVMARLGRIPAVGDTVELPGFRFRVTAMDGLRVDRVLVERRPGKSEREEAVRE